MVVRELLTRLGYTLDKTGVKQAEASFDSIKAKAQSLVGFVARLGALIGLSFSAKKILDIGESWTVVRARVALTTKSIQEQDEVMQGLYEVAQDTKQEFTATADLFSKVNRNADALNLTTDKVLSVTEMVNKSLRIGGGEAAQNEAAILQFGQALASGVLQGDELRSLLENAPRLTQALADGFGVTIGELRKMGSAGKLTAEEVINALLSQGEVLDEEFKKIPLTLSGAITYMSNAFGRFIDNMNKDTKTFEKLSKLIVSATDKIIGGFDKVIKALGGWDNAFKLAAMLAASLGIAFIAIKWTSIVDGIRSVAKALMDPAFLKFALIAAVVMLVLLVIEDLYTWLNGGDSVIGKWLESIGVTTEDVKNAWNSMVEFIKSAFEIAMYVLQPLIEFLGYLFHAVVSVIIDDWSGFFDALRGMAESGMEFLRRFLALFGIDADEVVQNVKTFFADGFTFIKGVVSEFVNFVKPLFEAFAHYIKAIISLAKGDWSGFFTELKGMCDSALQFISNIFAIFGIDIIAIIESVKNFFAGAIDSMRAAAATFFDFINPLIEYWGSFFQAIISLVTGDFEGFFQDVQDMADAAFKFIGNVLSLFGIDADEMASFFKNTWDGAIEAVKGFFGGLFDMATGGINSVINMINKIPLVDIPKVPTGGVSVSSASKAGVSSSRTSNVKQDINIQNQFGSGSTKYQQGMVSQAAASNYKDTYGQLSRGLAYGR